MKTIYYYVASDSILEMSDSQFLTILPDSRRRLISLMLEVKRPLIEVLPNRIMK